MNVNGSFNAGFVQYTLLTWYKCSVYFCKTEIVISIWQHFRSEERQTFKNVQNQFIFKNSLLTKYFWYKLVQFFVKSRLSILKSSKDSLEWVANTTAALMNGPIFETCNSNSNTSNHSRCAHIRLQLALSYMIKYCTQRWAKPELSAAFPIVTLKTEFRPLCETIFTLDNAAVLPISIPPS